MRGAFCQVPVVRGDTLIAVDEEGVVQALRLDRRAFAVARRIGRAGADWSVSLSGDLAFAGTASGDLVALSATTGKERWRTRLEERLYARSPYLAGEHIVCGDSLWSGTSRAYRDSGQVVWERGLGRAADPGASTG